MRVGITKYDLSDVGFEPTPTYVDQNTRMNLKPYKWWIFGCRTFYVNRLH